MPQATLARPMPQERGALVPRLVALAARAGRCLGIGAPLADLGVRLFVAAVFFQSGLTKIANWDSTLSLFENEYAVPLLPSNVAAYLGTGVELFFPVLLVLGLGTRFAAFVLFVFNIVAVVSYPGPRRRRPEGPPDSGACCCSSRCCTARERSRSTG